MPTNDNLLLIQKAQQIDQLEKEIARYEKRYRADRGYIIHLQEHIAFLDEKIQLLVDRAKQQAASAPAKEPTAEVKEDRPPKVSRYLQQLHSAALARLVEALILSPTCPNSPADGALLELLQLDAFGAGSELEPILTRTVDIQKLEKEEQEKARENRNKAWKTNDVVSCCYGVGCNRCSPQGSY